MRQGISRRSAESEGRSGGWRGLPGAVWEPDWEPRFIPTRDAGHLARGAPATNAARRGPLIGLPWGHPSGPRRRCRDYGRSVPSDRRGCVLIEIVKTLEEI